MKEIFIVIALFSMISTSILADTSPKDKPAKDFNIISIWGGWNFSISTKYDTLLDDLGADVSGRKLNTNMVIGGIDYWRGNKFQYGLSVAYVGLYTSDFTISASPYSIVKGNIASLFQIRYFINFFYIGLGTGFGFDIATVKGNDTSITGRSKSGIAECLLAGVQIEIGKNFLIDVGAKGYFIFTDAFYINIAPHISFGIKF